MRKQKALKAYSILREISGKILKAHKMMLEPELPVNRTRPWQEGGASGVLYHYTGGPDGLKSMKWCSKPSWGNTSSSWHVTIFDRVEDNQIGNMWIELCPDWLLVLFPVPTIIMASWENGTWHGNWTNRFMLGVENRSVGYRGKNNGYYFLLNFGKDGELVGDRLWEPYTREQIIANINIGRVAKGMFNQLRPDDILTHQCIWATKSDTGPLFPIHDIRNAIFGDTKRRWLHAFRSTKHLASNIGTDDYDVWVYETEPRCELEEIKSSSPRRDLEIACQWLKLRKLGYSVTDRKSFINAVRYFQKSTHAFKYRRDGKKRVLKVDGIFGKKTNNALNMRLKSFGL